jgi:phosphoribosylanthranilate isomerase
LAAAADLSRLSRAVAGGQVDRPPIRVGVFVDPTPDELARAIDLCPLDMIQLHGSEQPSLVHGGPRLPIIKAITWRPANEDDAAVAWMWSRAAGELAFAGFLVDAFDPVQRGGTGRCVRWDLLSPRPSPLAPFPLILAGGLKADNVRQAIALTSCQAVDTASGIESAPGVKDAGRMQAFIEQARLSFQQLSLSQEMNSA